VTPLWRARVRRARDRRARVPAGLWPAGLCPTLLVARPLNKTQLSSLDFVMNTFLIKLFSTSNMEIITYCREQFNFELLSVIMARHTSLFFG